MRAISFGLLVVALALSAIGCDQSLAEPKAASPKQAEFEHQRLLNEITKAELRGLTVEEQAGANTLAGIFGEYTYRKKKDEQTAAEWFLERVKDKHLTDLGKERSVRR
jgi:hypothetical protein